MLAACIIIPILIISLFDCMFIYACSKLRNPTEQRFLDDEQSKALSK